ncbi:hypothetical protein ACHBTE_09420 [Streptomyces sp. M41]|uniref:hypothetical protein n=1 Tax=Streptomyces sp. M41 TaxID=3059412 RepID=UPI00374D2937
MKYIDVNGGSSGSGGSDGSGGAAGGIDPTAYLARLTTLAGQLPAGARAFATDPGHYDFSGKRCVKDLRPHEVRRIGDDRIELHLRHNCWKHDEDLVVRYAGVSRFQVAGVDAVGGAGAVDVCDVQACGEVILDEVLAHPQGCSHEIACRQGTLLVVGRDLVAEWVTADCANI